jgi:sec-independent protein translocase protein TatA
MGLFDSPTHILIVLVVLVLLFGSAKLPKLAKSLGESMRIFKKEAQKLNDETGDGKPEVPGTAQQQLSAMQQPPASPPVTVQLPDGTTVSGTPVSGTPVTEPPGTSQQG